jgi:hypothetical protein
VSRLGRLLFLAACVTGLGALASCAGLVGITGDYTIADGAVVESGPFDGSPPPSDHASPPDGKSEGSMRDTFVAEAGDSSSGCMPPKTMCGTSCVDLSTDLANCGHCGTACTTTAPSTASCTEGSCVVDLIPGIVATSIILDTSNVYLATGLGNSILSVQKAGGTPSTVASQSLPIPLASDGVDLYWSDTGSTTGLFKCPLGCSAPKPISTLEVTGTDLGLGGGFVFFAAGGNLNACSKSGCSSSPRIVGQTSAFSRGTVTDGTNIYWASAGGTGPSGIFRQALAGGSTTTISTSPAENLIADAALNLYWVTSAGAVMTCRAASCSPTTLVSGTYKAIVYYAIATDGASLYWSNSTTIYKCSVAGCSSPTVVLKEPTYDLAVDGTSVFAANGGAGLRKITPK